MAEIFLGNNQIGGGTTDLSNYYNKSEIDSSFGETYLVKITNASGYYCYVPRTMSDADKATILSKLNTKGAVVLTVPNGQALSNKIGSYSINNGDRNSASGLYSHAEGNYSESKNWYSHAEGYFTRTSADYQHVEGKYNADASTAIKIVGNGTGTSNSQRHNALEVHLSGEVKIADTHASGEVYEKPMIVLQDKLHQIDASIIQVIEDRGAYEEYISLDDYDALVSGNNVDPDKVYYIQDLVDTSTLSDLVNVSTLSSAINNAVSALAPCEFTTLDDYDALVSNNNVDADKIYIINDIADSSDFSDFLSKAQLNSALEGLLTLGQNNELMEINSSGIRTSVGDFRVPLMYTGSIILDNYESQGELFIRDSNGDLYQINVDQFCSNFGTLVAE